MLSNFDAFPKVEGSYQVHQGRNRPMNLLFVVVAVYILYLETTTWMGSWSQFEYDVYKGVSEQFEINLDITIEEPCRNVAIYIQDVSDDRLLVNELVSSHSVVPYEGSDAEWCRVSGIFDTNRVKGRLSITAPGGSPGAAAMQRTFDSSHHIRELSFGEYYPYQINPLDHTDQQFSEPTATMYFLSILPSTYEALGAKLETNEYSVTVASKPAGAATGIIPGVYFEYDFDPIAVHIKDMRMSFFQWLLRVTNIGGGVLFAARAFNRFFSRRRGLSSDRTRSGLLDVPEKGL